MTLSSATTPGQSEAGNNCNEGVLRIPPNPCITGASSSDFLVSYPGPLLGESYSSAEMLMVYSISPADLAKIFRRILQS